MQQNYRKARFVDVFKYSFGGLGSNLAFFLVMYYLTYFYTDIFGISPFVVSGLMLVARFIDAFTDPLMGMLGDHTRTKLGKYRPWVIFGAPILGFSIFLLFLAPNLSPTMKIVYAYVIYIFYSLASTVVNIPYHSLTPVMSDDPFQRTVIVSWKQGMGTAAQFVITILALPLVEAFGGGRKGWAVYGALIGIMTMLSFFLCAWGAKPYDVCKELPKGEKKEKVSFLKDLKLLFTNKPMMMLMIAFGTDVLASACSSGANMYYFKYVLDRMDLVPVVSSVTLATTIAAIPCVPWLANWLGKKRLYFWGNVLSILPLALLFFSPSPSVMLIYIMLGAAGFTIKIVSDLGWGMLPECSDYAEWKNGRRADGLMSSSITFINKFGMAIGGFLCSFLLGLVGFVPNEVQSQACLNMISFLRFGMPILGYIASIISMHFYEITPEKFAEIKKALDERAKE